MWWQMLIQYAMNFTSGYFTGMQQKAQIEAENAARKEANISDTQQAAQHIGQLEVRKSFLRGEAALKDQAISTAGLTAGAQAEAQAAALGVKGASVDAVQQQTVITANEATAAMYEDTLMSEYNLNLEAIKVATQTRLNLRNYEYVPTEGEIIRGALATAANDTASSYFGGGGGGGMGGMSFGGGDTGGGGAASGGGAAGGAGGGAAAAG